MRAFLQLACAALVLAGCGGRRHGASAVQAATPAPPAAPGALARAFVMTPRETSLTQPAPPPPEPTAHYASLEAARDAIDAMLRGTVSTADTAIHFSRKAATFDYIWVKASARALALSIVVNDTTACPHDALMNTLRAAGWVDDWHYSADGDDGTQMGLVLHSGHLLG